MKSSVFFCNDLKIKIETLIAVSANRWLRSVNDDSLRKVILEIDENTNYSTS